LPVSDKKVLTKQYLSWEEEWPAELSLGMFFGGSKLLGGMSGTTVYAVHAAADF